MHAIAGGAVSLVISCVAAGSPVPIAVGPDAFVHISGEKSPVAMLSGDQGLNPEIEKLLTRPDKPTNLWERIRLGFSIPDLDGPLVAQQAAWYAARPELVQAIIQRARRYLHFIVAEVERRGLPTELALLPFVESGFNPMALSSAQASGLWQFIPETGSRYKLAQNVHYDGRRDIVASTGAALDYLQFLHDFNGRDWHRALASYNWGEMAVARAVERNRARGKPEDYDRLRLPDETRNYVPRLLAIKKIVLNPGAYGIQLAEILNEPVFEVIPIPADLDLGLAARLAQLPLNDILALNPAFNSRRASGSGDSGLVIPIEHSEIFRSNLEQHQEALAIQSAAAKSRSGKLKPQ